MLYELHDSLVPGIGAGDGRTLTALRVLLTRSGEGKHLLLGSRRVIDALHRWAETERLDNERLGALQGVDRRLKEARSLRAACPWRVEVVADAHSFGWVPDRRVWRLPVGRVEDSDTVAACRLVTEGTVDGALFLRAAQALRFHPRQPSHRDLVVNLEPRLGAGSQIGEVLQQATASGAPALCWVDQDGAAQDASPIPNSTAEKAMDAAGACAGPALALFIGGREIENLLPRRLIDAAVNKPGVQNPSLQGTLLALHRRGAFFPDPRGREAELKDALPPALSRSCAEVLTVESPEKAAQILFADDDGTWLRIAEVTLAWGCAARRVRVT